MAEGQLKRELVGVVLLVFALFLAATILMGGGTAGVSSCTDAHGLLGPVGIVPALTRCSARSGSPRRCSSRSCPPCTRCGCSGACGRTPIAHGCSFSRVS